jgi:tRNA (guanine10-N2)-dimethyltransferase
LTTRSLALLSGENHPIPEAEAKALFLAYDQKARFESPEPRVLMAESIADPFLVASRVAFSRRVGRLLERAADAGAEINGKKVRLRNFDIGKKPALDPDRVLQGLDCTVDLINPDYELTLIRGVGEYLVLTKPGGMYQGWSHRRPRARPYFHPSAIFPKLSRALVNLSRCTEGQLFLDPFAGTGSLPLEAELVGARVVALDQTAKMVQGALLNMKHFGEEWLGVVRASAFKSPLTHVDAVATDIPYGKLSSTGGKELQDVLSLTLSILPDILLSGSRAVLMHPSQMKVVDSADLELEEEHDLYVHKLLTRTISVLRRR